MRGSDRQLAVVVGVAVAIVVLGAYIPLAFPTDAWWRYSPGRSTVSVVYGLLWIPLLALVYRRDRRNRMWLLILVYLGVSAFESLSFLKVDAAWAVDFLARPLAAVLLVHLCLAFPTGRLPHRTDVAVVAVAYVLVIPIQLLGMATGDAAAASCDPGDWCPTDLVQVADVPSLFALAADSGLLAPPIVVVVIVELLRHLRSASRAGRRALVPVAVGAPTVFALFGIYYAAPPAGYPEVQRFLEENSLMDLARLLTPCLFLLGMLWTRLGRGAVADLAIAIGRGVPLGGLEDAIRRALRDPTLRLAFPAPDGPGLVDPAGHAMQLSPDRATARLERDDALLAVIEYDRVLEREDPGLVAAAVQVARLALDNERLSAQVRAQLEEVRASRQRIVQAADSERRRVERDLHDGAQQRLVALSMRLELARETSAGAGALIDETTAELATAIAEVRGLARALHPPILTEAGLRAAVESLAERLPIPVEIAIPGARYPAAVEATAYHVIAEVLGGIGRRPGAVGARVVVRADDHELHVRVEDDGAGPEGTPDQASRIRALLDRVAAMGGSLSVERGASGTRVDATVPV